MYVFLAMLQHDHGFSTISIRQMYSLKQRKKGNLKKIFKHLKRIFQLDLEVLQDIFTSELLL